MVEPARRRPAATKQGTEGGYRVLRVLPGPSACRTPLHQMLGRGLLQHRSRSVVLVVVAAQNARPRRTRYVCNTSRGDGELLIIVLPGRSMKMPGLYRS
jgi:hypothetical protein